MNMFLKLRHLIMVSPAVAIIGCGAPDDGQTIEGSSAALSDQATLPDAVTSPVLVREKEFSVTPARRSVPAGSVTFKVLNQGTEEHEFLVVRTDLTADQLPTNPDGSFDEEGAGVEVIDEIEGIEPGTMETLTVSLDAGHYILLCNRVEVEEDGEIESHFQEGMHADFMVR